MYEKAEVITKEVWSENLTLKFSSTQNGVSVLLDSGESVVEITTLNSIFAEKRITFIKIDIEGADLEALKDARTCIKENMHKQAVCVYHNPENIVTLPQRIPEMNLDYRLHLKHYSLSVAETVQYAF